MYPCPFRFYFASREIPISLLYTIFRCYSKNQLNFLKFWFKFVHFYLIFENSGSNPKCPGPKYGWVSQVRTLIWVYLRSTFRVPVRWILSIIYRVILFAIQLLRAFGSKCPGPKYGRVSPVRTLSWVHLRSTFRVPVRWIFSVIYRVIHFENSGSNPQSNYFALSDLNVQVRIMIDCPQSVLWVDCISGALFVFVDWY